MEQLLLIHENCHSSCCGSPSVTSSTLRLQRYAAASPLADIIELHLVPILLCTHAGLEHKVCGDSDVRVELLMSATVH